MTQPNLISDLFHEDAIDPKTLEINEKIRAAMKDGPRIDRIPLVDMRAARENGTGVFPARPKSDRATTRTIPGKDCEVGLRIIAPENPSGIYLHIHGGGWVNGANDQNDPLMEHFADHHNMAVVSVEYRLAPEHRFPAAPDDCEAAATWLVENCQEEFGTDWLSVGGESAGAHLAALTMIRMRDKHDYTGFKAANLVFGIYDVSLSPSVRTWRKGRLVLDTDTMRFFTNCFAPDPHMQRLPKVSPLFAKLHDLPHALFTVGTLDPLVDDTLFMHGRWAAAGNGAELEVFPGGIHGFPAFGGPLAKQFVHTVDDFFTRQLALNG
jgi:acetyl esterase/lipase